MGQEVDDALAAGEVDAQPGEGDQQRESCVEERVVKGIVVGVGYGPDDDDGPGEHAEDDGSPQGPRVTGAHCGTLSVTYSG